MPARRVAKVSDTAPLASNEIANSVPLHISGYIYHKMC
jgi:hypothetical protein